MDGAGSFAWGVATSAYQIEGAPFEDGAGESIWDRFAAEPGRIAGGGDGTIACDHYHRWQEDIRLMADLGVNAYRFSIAWTRVLPMGTGTVNAAGMGFYDRLVDGLLDAGITPYITLYHWDLPQALQDRGGWPSRATVGAFVEYADAVTAVLGDRVQNWITHNEPWVASFLGHLEGTFAPGVRSWQAALSAAHHILLSHGKAVPVIRANVADARVGIALDCRPCAPATDTPDDAAAARHFDGFRNRWFFDAVFGFGYPDDMLASYTERGHLPEELVQDGDMHAIAAPIDFLGLNYYTTLRIAAGQEETELPAVPPSPNPPKGFTAMGWAVAPQGMTEYLAELAARYGPRTIVITENGASYSGSPGPDGRVRDPERIEYLDAHIGALERAVAAGVPVSGYFVWSLLDNLEWANGYSQQFGLVFVDRKTGRRTPKDSYYWYRGRIKAASGAADRSPIS